MSSRPYAPGVSFACAQREPLLQHPTGLTRNISVRYLERQIVQAWKSVTRATRKKQNRVSTLPCDFVFVTARRRSTIQYQPLAKSGRF